MENQQKDKVEYSEPANLRDLLGAFKTVSVAPTAMPKKVGEQIVLYVSGGTKRLYIANLSANVWYYVNLT